jgi:predicted dehydrogenase
MALAAISGGIHILCETPLALATVEGEEMLAAAAERGVVHAVNYDYRVIPDHERFHQLLTDGYVGAVAPAHLCWMSDHNADEGIHRGWRHDRREAGFGVIVTCTTSSTISSGTSVL